MDLQPWNTPQRKIRFRVALLWILLITVVISGSTLIAILYYLHIQEIRELDPKYHIVAIVQSSTDREALKTVYLEELLDLSIDQPVNIHRFNCIEARNKLLTSPLIKDAEVKKILPGTIYVKYNLRKPIAYLGDYTNTAIDKEGFLIPFNPFFTPKNLPEIILGFQSNDNSEHSGMIWKGWGTPISGMKAELAFKLYHFISSYCCSETSVLKRIDVSRAFASSFGQRQIVIVLEDLVEKKIDRGVSLLPVSRILRLSTEAYQQQLAQYLVLRDRLRSDEAATILDMRIPQLAFIRTVK